VAVRRWRRGSDDRTEEGDEHEVGGAAYMRAQGGSQPEIGRGGKAGCERAVRLGRFDGPPELGSRGKGEGRLRGFASWLSSRLRDEGRRMDCVGVRPERVWAFGPKRERERVFLFIWFFFYFKKPISKAFDIILNFHQNYSAQKIKCTHVCINLCVAL
jgi:hypothetical protein